MFKKIVQIILLSIAVFILGMMLFGWFWQKDMKQSCHDFANKASSNPALMDKTFKALLSVKTIKDFDTYQSKYIEVYYSQHRDDNITSIIDWEDIFNNDSLGNAVLTYKYSPKYEKEVQSGIVHLDMIESVYIGNTRKGLRFIFKRTQQGDIDKNNYGLEAECELLGDIPRAIKIKGLD